MTAWKMRAGNHRRNPPPSQYSLSGPADKRIPWQTLCIWRVRLSTSWLAHHGRNTENKTQSAPPFAPVNNHLKKRHGDETCSLSDGRKTPWIELVRRGLTRNMWDRLMESRQAMLTVDMLRAALPAQGKPALMDETIRDPQVVFEDAEQVSFEEWWQLMLSNGRPVKRLQNPQ